ncbi:hypothetical protein GQ53DRAFT_536042 [Thozetella sp. PMI_491]|nr:hypothetical protein GQ53DRAFT_536042 [Thozetella sp. PMI_491]
MPTTRLGRDSPCLPARVVPVRLYEHPCNMPGQMRNSVVPAARLSEDGEHSGIRNGGSSSSSPHPPTVFRPGGKRYYTTYRPPGLPSMMSRELPAPANTSTAINSRKQKRGRKSPQTSRPTPCPSRGRAGSVCGLPWRRVEFFSERDAN